MEQLLCEPEDRLGSQASSSVSRPNSMIVQARRSGFIAPVGTSGNVDGANLIKVAFFTTCRIRRGCLTSCVGAILRPILGSEA